MPWSYLIFFFFNDTATTEIYTLSLHDALPILRGAGRDAPFRVRGGGSHARARQRRTGTPAPGRLRRAHHRYAGTRSEEHTSELQSRLHLVCRLLLEKKKKHATSAALTS